MSKDQTDRQPCQFPDGELMGSIWHHLHGWSLQYTKQAYVQLISNQNPFNMWTGLTSNIRPSRNTIATQETMSAWFWITNSWLSTGGFLFVFFRTPILTGFNPTFPGTTTTKCNAFTTYSIWLSLRPITLKAPRPGSSNWMACHSCSCGRYQRVRVAASLKERFYARAWNIDWGRVSPPAVWSRKRYTVGSEDLWPFCEYVIYHSK